MWVYPNSERHQGVFHPGAQTLLTTYLADRQLASLVRAYCIRFWYRHYVIRLEGRHTITPFNYVRGAGILGDHILTVVLNNCVETYDLSDFAPDVPYRRLIRQPVPLPYGVNVVLPMAATFKHGIRHSLLLRISGDAKMCRFTLKHGLEVEGTATHYANAQVDDDHFLTSDNAIWHWKSNKPLKCHTLPPYHKRWWTGNRLTLRPLVDQQSFSPSRCRFPDGRLVNRPRIMAAQEKWFLCADDKRLYLHSMQTRQCIRVVYARNSLRSLGIHTRPVPHDAKDDHPVSHLWPILHYGNRIVFFTYDRRLWLVRVVDGKILGPDLVCDTLRDEKRTFQLIMNAHHLCVIIYNLHTHVLEPLHVFDIMD